MERIVARRGELIADLARLHDQGKTSKFADNALKLLTRWWSKSTWDGREKLLKAAEWLCRCELSASEDLSCAVDRAHAYERNGEPY